MNRPQMEEDGRKLLLALYTQNRWLIRTVDRVSFIDRNTVRRRISRHFTLPPDKAACPEWEDRVILPVFALRKGSFISCDLRDAGDRRIALRPIEERWELTFQALMSLFREADSKGAKDPLLSQHVRDVVEKQHAWGPRHELLAYGKAMQSRSPAIATVVSTHAFEQLSRFLALNYLVFADVPRDEGRSHMISYVVDQRFPDRRQDFEMAGMAHPPRRQIRKLLGLVPHSYYHPWTISGAGSSHLEIEAPDGVEFGRRMLQLPNVPPITAMGTSTRRARFLAPRTTMAGEGYARIGVMPGHGVMRRGGPAVVVLFTALLAVIQLAHIRPSAATTLLLFLPSFAAIVTSKPNEHPYVTRVVIWIRIMILSPIPLAAVATAALLAGWPSAVIWVLIGIAAITAFILSLGERLMRGRPDYLEYVGTDLTRVA